MNKIIKLLYQFAIIVGCLFLGEFIVDVIKLPLPGSIVGMILLTSLLATGVVKISQVEQAATLLLHWLPLFFIPAGVAIILYLDIISENLFAIFFTVFTGIIIVIWTTGITYTLLRKYIKTTKRSDSTSSEQSRLHNK